MKKILAIVLLTFMATTASAHGYWHGGYYRNNWVAPFVVGAGVGYLATRPYYAPPPNVVYIQPAPMYYQQPYPAAPNGYHYQQIVDQTCNCYKMALVPN